MEQSLEFTFSKEFSTALNAINGDANLAKKSVARKMISESIYNSRKLRMSYKSGIYVLVCLKISRS